MKMLITILLAVMLCGCGMLKEELLERIAYNTVNNVAKSSWGIREVSYNCAKYNDFGDFSRVFVVVYEKTKPWNDTCFNVWVDRNTRKVVKIDNYSSEWVGK